MPPSLDMRASRRPEPLQGVGARHARGTSPLCVALRPLRALAENHVRPLFRLSSEGGSETGISELLKVERNQYTSHGKIRRYFHGK